MFSKYWGDEKRKADAHRHLADYKKHLESGFYRDLDKSGRYASPADFKLELTRETSLVTARFGFNRNEKYRKAIEEMPCHSEIIAYYRNICPDNPLLYFELASYNAVRNDDYQSKLPIDRALLIKRIDRDLQNPKINLVGAEFANTFQQTLITLRRLLLTDEDLIV